MRFSTLDRYLLREWGGVLLITLLGFPILVIVIDLTDKLDTYLGRGIKPAVVALSYVFDFPEKMFLILPVAVLFATVFTVGSLGRHSELTAAKASGISFHRLVLPLFAAAGAAFVAGLVLAEIAPVSTSRRLEMLGEKAIRSTTSRYNFVYRADRGWVYAIRALELKTREMTDLMLEREGTGAAYPTIVLAAQRAVYSDTGGGPAARRPRWTLHRGTLRYLAENQPGGETAFEFDSLRSRTLRERPVDLLAEPKAPDEMRYGGVDAESSRRGLCRVSAPESTHLVLTPCPPLHSGEGETNLTRFLIGTTFSRSRWAPVTRVRSLSGEVHPCVGSSALAAPSWQRRLFRCSL